MAVKKSGISADELWEMIGGKGSLLELFASTVGLNELVRDVSVETIERSKFEVIATRDRNTKLPLIRMFTGCYDKIHSRLLRACEVTSSDGRMPWEMLGWRRSKFRDPHKFAALMSRIIIDFLVLHELGHIVRGHVDRYVAEVPFGMSETVKTTHPHLTSRRRQALELDADSCALYHLVTLHPLLLAHYRLYRDIPNLPVLITVLNLGISIVFMFLSEHDTVRTSKLTLKRASALIQRHRGLTHPLPHVRAEYAQQRIMKLSVSRQERRVFQQALERSWVYFMTLVTMGIFPSMPRHLWEDSAADVTAFVNSLIEELEQANFEGWLQVNTRSERALNIVEALRKTQSK